MFRKLLFGLATMVAVFSNAQSVPSAPYLSVRQRGAFLLANKQVRANLNLDSAEQQRIAQALSSHAAAQHRLLAKSEPSTSAIAKNDKAFADSALAALTESQRTHLLKMTLRSVGVPALADPEIAHRLAMTPAQTKKVHELLDRMSKRSEDFEAMVAKGFDYVKRPKPGEDRAEYEKTKAAILKSYDAERAKMVSDQAAMANKVLGVLNSKQRSQWAQLSS